MSLKRIFDIIVSLVGLIFLSPLLVIIAVTVRVKLGAPVLFSQVRTGMNGAPFKVYRFRTMIDKRDFRGQLLPYVFRLGRFGRFLRSTSLNELPELFNVLKGEMSLVGPRPLLPKYLSLYDPEQRRRNEVKPGLTGWAQVNGGTGINWKEMFRLDAWYVDHYSFCLDLKILWMVLKGALLREENRAKRGAALSELFPSELPFEN